MPKVYLLFSPRLDHGELSQFELVPCLFPVSRLTAMKVLTLLAVLIPLVTLNVSAWRINKVYKVRTTARLSRGMEELFQRAGSQYIRSCNLPVFSSSSVLDCQAKCSFYRAEGGALKIIIMKLLTFFSDKIDNRELLLLQLQSAVPFMSTEQMFS